MTNTKVIHLTRRLPPAVADRRRRGIPVGMSSRFWLTYCGRRINDYEAITDVSHHATCKACRPELRKVTS